MLKRSKKKLSYINNGGDTHLGICLGLPKGILTSVDRKSSSSSLNNGEELTRASTFTT
jgi:hypothetical protein